MKTDDVHEKVHFSILGPLEITVEGAPFPLRGLLLTCVLAMLLLEPGRVVPLHRLVQAVWGERPPDTATHQVRKAVSTLRNRLPDGAKLIVTDADGYRIVLDEDQLDAGLFAIRLRRAQSAEDAGLLDNAAAELRAGLKLWRGEALQGLSGPPLSGAVMGWRERRYQTAERYIDLRMRLGETNSVTGDIRDLIAEEPLRESLRHQLILALYRSGRQADALDEFATVRNLLADELGIPPGPRLLALHEAVLLQSPELDVPPPPVTTHHAPPAFVPEVARPCTLPYDLPDFTGREEPLHRLTELTRAGTESGTRIVAIDGMAGVGKTALAVHAAHQLAQHYDDGQLYIDLRGHPPDSTPLKASDALGLLLRTMGVPDDRIPAEHAGRVALWRMATARKRLLLLVDNAVNAEQVAPLIPGSAHCLALITSRARLTEPGGVSWLSLDVLPHHDSAHLITHVLGPQRTEAEPEALAELTERCGHLPLALRLAADRLAARPQWTIRHMADLLAQEHRRLRELRSGERSVTAALSLSYTSMTPQHRTALRLLGTHPGPTISRARAATMLGTDPDQTDEILEELLDTHLLQQPREDHYIFHPLVRSFARSLPTEPNEPPTPGTGPRHTAAMTR